ncbi:methyltransferase domain protein [Striga asiatica]|uniref:Methyltransferase domain protein n=1 Tax=Striga asiatica TaxID=4170 RepID=A0A5A7R3X2_STRAF|nr:methyltransferase domain protein [Striga asiatica]
MKGRNLGLWESDRGLLCCHVTTLLRWGADEPDVAVGIHHLPHAPTTKRAFTLRDLAFSNSASSHRFGDGGFNITGLQAEHASGNSRFHRSRGVVNEVGDNNSRGSKLELSRENQRDLLLRLPLGVIHAADLLSSERRLVELNGVVRLR